MSWGEPDNATVLTAIVGAFSAVVVGLISFFGGRGSVQAQIQTSLNQSFQTLTDALQEERTSDRRRIGQLEANVRGLEQHVSSLEALLRRNGIDIPVRPVTTTVFILDSGDPPSHNSPSGSAQ